MRSERVSGAARCFRGDVSARLRSSRGSGGGGDPVAVVGWPGASQPPAPTDPGVTVSRHRALLTGRSGRVDPLPVGE